MMVFDKIVESSFYQDAEGRDVFGRSYRYDDGNYNYPG